MMNVLTLLVFLLGTMAVTAQETLPTIEDGKAPKTFEEAWAGFDPQAEPLDVEVLKEWEQDGIVLQVLRYRIGIFKGQKAMMAGVYGYPKGGKDLPGLVQIHGGGQYAHWHACLTNAKRGYATISISWAGRISAPDYTVNPDVVKLFWEGKTHDPNYKLTTDWGAVDGYHAPFRYKHGFSVAAPHEHTLDSVASPRNDSWFLCALGGRRALTFLERQPEVDGSKLGVYGHSMGGKLTVMVAGSDDRVKAAAPSCGGISDRTQKDPMIQAVICDNAYLKRMTCPTIFLSPANDFHGRIDDLPASVDEIQTDDWRVTCAAHHNHQDTAAYEVGTQVWMDQQLKGTFEVPATPQTELKLKTKNGVPSLTVTPDASKPILYVDVHYTQQGQADGKPDDGQNTMNRFWHHVAPVKQGDTWTAELPVLSTDKPLWVYANVVYPLDKPISGAGYYYGTYTTDRFNLSSLVHLIAAGDLKAAGVKATMTPSLVIEAFEPGWEKEWFSYRPAEWARSTHKLYDPRWAAPEGAKLAMEARCEEANTLVVGLDESAAEVALEGGAEWQPVILSEADVTDATGDARSDWNDIKTLRLAAQETLREQVDGEGKTRKVGAAWKGAAPEFRNLRWVE
ncbi:MAG: dienelactone hydrolase family protein [Kiritimatiellae bacterium]|nr:dienelactone hydrolase family protein [Kiritimatiellia bacterium]